MKGGNINEDEIDIIEKLLLENNNAIVDILKKYKISDELYNLDDISYNDGVEIAFDKLLKNEITIVDIINNDDFYNFFESINNFLKSGYSNKLYGGAVSSVPSNVTNPDFMCPILNDEISPNHRYLITHSNGIQTYYDIQQLWTWIHQAELQGRAPEDPTTRERYTPIEITNINNALERVRRDLSAMPDVPVEPVVNAMPMSASEYYKNVFTNCIGNVRRFIERNTPRSNNHRHHPILDRINIILTIGHTLLAFSSLTVADGRKYTLSQVLKKILIPSQIFIFTLNALSNNSNRERRSSLEQYIRTISMVLYLSFLFVIRHKLRQRL